MLDKFTGETRCEDLLSSYPDGVIIVGESLSQASSGACLPACLPTVFEGTKFHVVWPIYARLCLASPAPFMGEGERKGLVKLALSTPCDSNT